MPETLGEWALEYARHGFAVFPLAEGTKIPLKGSHGKSDATTDEDQIRQWWADHPKANIGIATGSKSHGLIVIDVDTNPAKNKQGRKSLEEWTAEHGEFPPTCVAISGSGGLHYYYRSPLKFKSIDNVGGTIHIDQEGEGGSIVAPPSWNKETGGYYTWQNGENPFKHPPGLLTGSAKEFAQRELYSEPDAAVPADRAGGMISTRSRTGAMVSLIGKLRSAQLSEEAIIQAVRIENNRFQTPLTQKELGSEVFPSLKRNWKVSKPYYATDEQILAAMPEPESLKELAKDPPEPSPVLIDNTLRQGHKMILCGPSKAGKSFALMELAISIAEGMSLGVWDKCKQGKVLYINMEIDRASCIDRFLRIYKDGYGMTVEKDTHKENINIWSLRGFSRPLSELADYIIDKAGTDYAAIIIDPLYKVMDGDENSNSDVARMVSHFDRIVRETGAAIIYAHHFAKGTGGDRQAIDRGAGAGTYARDADAYLTMTQLDEPENPENPGRTAWRVEYVLREFGPHKPVSCWWEYPAHTINDALDDVELETSATRAARNKAKAQKEKRKQQIEDTHAAVNAIADPVTGCFSTSAFIQEYSQYEDITRMTAVKRLEQAGYVNEKPAKNGQASVWHRPAKR